jgi:hypothetical protein
VSPSSSAATGRRPTVRSSGSGRRGCDMGGRDSRGGHAGGAEPPQKGDATPDGRPVATIGFKPSYACRSRIADPHDRPSRWFPASATQARTRRASRSPSHQTTMSFLRSPLHTLLVGAAASALGSGISTAQSSRQSISGNEVAIYNLAGACAWNRDRAVRSPSR